MKKPKCSVLIAQFAYGSNGGLPSVLPQHVSWISNTLREMDKDKRIKKTALTTFADTPITMTRNLAARTAIDGGWDFILMIDSDNIPDCELKDDPEAKPFWKTSFDFAYERLRRDIPTVVCSPYCGAPPHENVFVFYWEGKENSDYTDFSIEAYSRDTAAMMAGIQEIAAGPTGVTLYSTSAFKLIKPPYFYYEYTDEYESQKASTEDVTNFRDLALNGSQEHGGTVVFCNWDAWAAHQKVKQVRKPRQLFVDDVSNKFRDAVSSGNERDCKYMDIDYTANLPSDIPKDGKCEDERRTIFGTKVTTFGFTTNIKDLTALRDLTASVEGDDNPIKVIEVGSWVGESAIAITSAFKHPDSVLYCVDHFRGSGEADTLEALVEEAGGPDEIYERFKTNCGDLLGTRIKLIREDSLVAAESLDKQNADIVFIDAGHSYEDTRNDILAWKRHVADHGVMCGHDYSWNNVKAAVDEVWKEFGEEVETLTDDVWAVRLTGDTAVDTTHSRKDSIVIQKRSIFGHVVTTVGHKTQMKDLEALRNIVESIAQATETPMRVIEVGSWVGESAIAMSKGFRVPGSTIYCVDNLSGSGPNDPITRVVEFVGGPDKVLDYFQRNCGDLYGNTIKLIQKESLQAAGDMDKQEADLVFIDANHEYDDVKADIIAWMRHVKSTGWLCGHDYFDEGVKQALAELFGENDTKIRVFDGTSVWIVSKADYEAGNG